MAPLVDDLVGEDQDRIRDRQLKWGRVYPGIAVRAPPCLAKKATGIVRHSR
jgi:hypothetical protein